MFSLTVVFGTLPATFLFRTKEAAEAATNSLADTAAGYTIIDDDFGQHAVIRGESTHGWLLEDMEQSKHAWAERMLHQARAQSIGQNAAAADRTLNTMAQRNGPAIISPMNGRF